MKYNTFLKIIIACAIGGAFQYFSSGKKSGTTSIERSTQRDQAQQKSQKATLVSFPNDSEKSDWDKYRKGIQGIAKDCGLDYSKLMWLSYFETNHGKVQCSKDPAGRLIKGVWQWTPSNRREFNIPENVDRLKPHEQLAFIHKYLKAQIKYFGKPNDTYYDYFLLNFLPDMMNKNFNYVAKDKFLKNNPSLDFTKDGKLTRHDIVIYIDKRIVSGMKASKK